MDMVYAISGVKSADKLIKNSKRNIALMVVTMLKVTIQAAVCCQHYWNTEENVFNEDELLQIKSPYGYALLGRKVSVVTAQKGDY
jgi:hypothetical protein